MRARGGASSAFAQYRALLMKDVRQELRTREMLTSMGVYALLVLTIYGAALSQATSCRWCPLPAVCSGRW